VCADGTERALTSRAPGQMKLERAWPTEEVIQALLAGSIGLGFKDG
jgi:hypothetical protein